MTTARRTGVTSFTTLVAASAAFVGVHLLAPQWARAAGLDFWAVAEETKLQQQAGERRREIEHVAERLAEQIAANDGITAALIDDRIVFAEAVDRIAEVNADRPGFPGGLRSGGRFTATDRELWEYYTLDRVRLRLEGDPSRLAEVMNRITCR